jgi:hypothetical protein
MTTQRSLFFDMFTRKGLGCKKNWKGLRSLGNLFDEYGDVAPVTRGPSAGHVSLPSTVTPAPVTLSLPSTVTPACCRAAVSTRFSCRAP